LQKSPDHLIKEHLPLARQLAGSLVHRMPPWIERDDLEQESYLGLVEAAGRFRHFQQADFGSPVPFGAYARKVMLGRMLELHRRRAARESRHEELHPGQLVSPGADLDRAVDLRWFRWRVWRILDRLSLRERDVIVLRYWKDLGQVEIARRLGVTQTCISRAHGRAVRRLRKELRAGGYLG
jgi:RNA polymerase sigma factor (sigma-70 family)